MAIAIHIENGRVSLRDGDRTLIAEAFARVTLANGATFTTEGGVATRDGDAWCIAQQGEVNLAWRIGPRAGGVCIVLVVENPGEYPLAIARLDVLVVPAREGEFRALEALQSGYMSWSFATPLAPMDQLERPTPPPVSAPLLPLTEAERFVSSGMTALGGDGANLLMGFLSARHYQSYLAIQPAPGGHRVTAACEVEDLPLPPGGCFWSGALWLATGDDADALVEAYAREVVRDHDVKPWPSVTTGWCSWYYYFTNVSEAAMRRNLDVLDAHRARMPVEVVQLDDGYQTAIGDWTSFNEKFPHGLRVLVDDIHARGYQAGLWLAPFFVGETSETYREHPDWVVRDAAGLPVNALTNWGHRNFALDTSHPEVIEHLEGLFHTIVEQWGFDYLKLDFIYAAALRGRRHAPVTGVEAYRAGLQLVRRVVGDRFILGCGALFLPSVGLVDGLRVGPDTAPFYRDPDPVGTAPALLNAIRSTLAHHWMHGRLWINDPDCLIVRRAHSDLTQAEVETWATVVALSGGMVLLSDDLAALEPQRAAIIPRLLPPAGKAALPVGPCVDGLPARLLLALADAELVALFNWDDEPRSLVLDPATLAGAEGPRQVVDLWRGAYYTLDGAPLSLGMTGAHGVRLLRVSRRRETPWLAGSLLTLAGQEVADVRWEDPRLVIELAAPGEHEGELIVAVPPGYELMEVPAGVAAPTGGCLRIPVQLRARARITLVFGPMVR